METTDFEVWLAAERLKAGRELAAAIEAEDSASEALIQSLLDKLDAAWHVLQTFKRAQSDF